jgi:lipopolysaccharide export system protein LptC
MHDPQRSDLLGRGRIDSARVFRRAMRHSRHVRILRIAVPACLAVLLAGLTLTTWLDPMRLLKRLPLDAGGLVISGTKITMASPKLTGYTRDQRWYEVTASAAAQDITKPDLVEMKDIRAKLEMQDKSTMNLSALDGLFDRKVGTLTLGRNIVLQSTSGLEIRLNNARIDTATGNIVSEQPVEVRMQQGVLNANRLEVTESGEVVKFDGGVTVNLKAEAVNQATEGMVQR